MFLNGQILERMWKKLLIWNDLSLLSKVCVLNLKLWNHHHQWPMVVQVSKGLKGRELQRRSKGNSFATTCTRHYQHDCFNIEKNSNHGRPKRNDPIHNSQLWTCFKGGKWSIFHVLGKLRTRLQPTIIIPANVSLPKEILDLTTPHGDSHEDEGSLTFDSSPTHLCRVDHNS